MGFFKRGFCNLASGVGKKSWGRVGEGLGKGWGGGWGGWRRVGEGLAFCALKTPFEKTY